MSLSRRNKIVVGVIVLVFTTVLLVKKTIYKPHESIEETVVIFKGKAKDLLETVKGDSFDFNGQAVELIGTIETKDEKGVMLKGGIYCQLLKTKDLSSLETNQEITVKGRLIGYDDLLEEIKLDKTIIIKQQ